MGVCKDKSTKYLKSLGYNTIRHPSEDIAPLQIIGRLNGSIARIGHVSQLVGNPEEELPDIKTDILAADIEGRRTSKLSVDLGLSILEGLISGLGGNAGIGSKYENSRTLQFKFTNVRKERTNIVSLGDYLTSGDIKWNHIILKKFLFGKGDLFVITSVVKSNSFAVESFGKKGAAVDVDVPAIKDLVKGELDIEYENEKKNMVSFAGDRSLVFGFQAVEFYADEDPDTEELTLSFSTAKPGTIALESITPPDQLTQQPVILNDGGAIERLEHMAATSFEE